MDTALAAAMDLHRSGRMAEAEAQYRRILALAPDFADAHNALGVALLQTGRISDAEHCFRRAVALNPHYAAAHGNLGAALVAQGRHDQAILSLKTALGLDSNLIDAHYNLAWSAQIRGEFATAEQGYRRLIAQHPGHAGAHNNLALVLRATGRLAESLPVYRRAAALAPQQGVIRYGLAQALLESGAFTEGWAEHEFRFQAHVSLNLHPELPPWQGETLPEGREILVWAEQGLGDSLQFCRYAALLARTGTRVILEVQPPLARLCQSLEGVTVVERGQPLPSSLSAQVPLMSLPRHLAPEPFWPGPYLAPPPALAAEWEQRLGPRRRPRIALVWAGSPTHRDDANRSIPAELLVSSLLPVDGAEVFSLQKGREAPALPGVTELGNALSDMADTAAALSRMDLLIAVDTSVLHLAGAMGMPVWGLLPFSPDWRWLSQGEDSAWYPSLRLFRQRTKGDWPDTLARLRSALAARVNSG